MAAAAAKCVDIYDERHYEGSKLPTPSLSLNEELVQVKNQMEALRDANPFRVVEMAIEIQIERMRVIEAMNARDAALQRLSDAYSSLRQKEDIIANLTRDHEKNRSFNGVFVTSRDFSPDRLEVDKLKAHIVTLEADIKNFQIEITKIRDNESKGLKSMEPPPSYDLGLINSPATNNDRSSVALNVLSPLPADLEGNQLCDDFFAKTQLDALGIGSRDALKDPPHQGPTEVEKISFDDPAERIKARNVVLAAIPLPENPPDDTLKPIILPPPFSLHEFLNGASGSLRNMLANYRVLQSITTLWCPEREEHGYFYTPMFKCNTNPRVATAHRWTIIDVIGRMNKPTECFYNKEGVWYYAGSYKAFQMDDLSVKEWAALSNETSQAIIRDTIAGRKNTSPQNIYETSQLYAAGALKVACVGLQCVGFNQELYKSILDHAAKFTQTKWKALAAACAPLPVPSPHISMTSTLPIPDHGLPVMHSPGLGKPTPVMSIPSAVKASPNFAVQPSMFTPPLLGNGFNLATGSSVWNANVTNKYSLGGSFIPLDPLKNDNGKENSSLGPRGDFTMTKTMK